ncbi:glycoside hydrolase family 43 protein [Aestuariivivens sediminis]|uniref:glycoside hydrolase family 43 protein n=1 Tax=Aestuariivivens sediminis TaxID=2913557 RepID=UPI001F5A5203|nr:glycoside hydrolase family 43 protein [Aestuariivivens sediminis]
MKAYQLILFGITLMTLSCSVNEEVYLFSYFKNNGEDGLHLAYSNDGLIWEALNDDKSFLIPELSKDKLMRDPCIIKGPDGKFHMVWTVSWEERGIGYSNSDDLINWSEQKFIPVMQHEKSCKNSWAPELFYDKNKDQYLIFWASTISDKFLETANQAEEDWNHRMYYTTTKDFEVFSETKIFLEPGFNVIDATISENENQYFMIVKDETLHPKPKKSLHILFSDNLYEWNVPVSKAISGNWVEGPTIATLNNAWIVYFDQYRKHSFGAIKSDDLVNWKDISNSISFPDGIRHGSVFKVSKRVFSKLKNHASN